MSPHHLACHTWQPHIDIYMTLRVVPKCRTAIQRREKTFDHNLYACVLCVCVCVCVCACVHACVRACVRAHVRVVCMHSVCLYATIHSWEPVVAMSDSRGHCVYDINTHKHTQTSYAHTLISIHTRTYTVTLIRIGSIQHQCQRMLCFTLL